jgi:hypothetical protein
MFGRKGDERTKGITQRKGRNGERNDDATEKGMEWEGT